MLKFAGQDSRCVSEVERPWCGATNADWRWPWRIGAIWKGKNGSGLPLQTVGINIQGCIGIALTACVNVLMSRTVVVNKESSEVKCSAEDARSVLQMF